MMLWHVAGSFQKVEMSNTTHSLAPFNPSLSTTVKLVVDGWAIVKEQRIKFTLPRVSFKDILSKLTTLKLSLFPDKKFHCPVIRVGGIGIVIRGHDMTHRSVLIIYNQLFFIARSLLIIHDMMQQSVPIIYDKQHFIATIATFHAWSVENNLWSLISRARCPQTIKI